jgi:hypothetical protein
MQESIGAGIQRGVAEVERAGRGCAKQFPRQCWPPCAVGVVGGDRDQLVRGRPRECRTTRPARAGTVVPGAGDLLNLHILGSLAFQVADLIQRPGAASDFDTERFRSGLDRLLDGLAAHAASAGRHRRFGSVSARCCFEGAALWV